MAPERRVWSRWIGPAVFGGGIALLTIGVMGWQRARARQAASLTQARRFSGAETIVARASRLPAPTLGAEVRVGILRDTASDRYFDRRNTMDSIITTWRTALGEIGAEARVVSPQEALSSRDEQVLIVPASPCLGREARHVLDDAARRGIGLVVTWLSGVRDGGCRRVGYGLITQVSGAERLDTLESDRSECYVTFLRGGPLATDIPPGARLELAVSNHVALRASRREAYFSDYMLNPRTVRGEDLVDGAIIQTNFGASRAVYWGFDLSTVVNRAWDRALALRLTRNSVAWAARLPLATVEPWPFGKTAAAAFAQDVEDEFANGRYALDSLRAAHVTGSYFLVSRLAKRNTELAEAMAVQGEVGTHTPRHRLLGGLPKEHQREVLEESQSELAEIVGHRVAGLRPPEEQFDSATLSAWLDAGGRYMFATMNGRAASPEVLSIGNRALVMLGRVTNDDFIEVGRRGITDIRALAESFIAGFEKVHALGGLYILSYHSQMLARPELVPALARVARYVGADSTAWIATTGAIADWWLVRSLLDTRARQIAPDRFVLEVHNGSARAVTGAVVRIAVGNADVRAVDGGLRALPSDDEAIRVLLPTLSPGERRSFSVVLDASAARRGQREPNAAPPRRRTSVRLAGGVADAR